MKNYLVQFLMIVVAFTTASCDLFQTKMEVELKIPFYPAFVIDKPFYAKPLGKNDTVILKQFSIFQKGKDGTWRDTPTWRFQPYERNTAFETGTYIIYGKVPKPFQQVSRSPKLQAGITYSAHATFKGGQSHVLFQFNNAGRLIPPE